MALFGMFNYAKPGPGVDKDAPKKKRFFYFFELYFRKFWKLVELNLLFCVCCLPIVTIGPAIAGMTYILRNFAQERPVFMVSDFWDAFKSNFKQGFCIWFLDVLVTGVASVAFAWYFINSGMSWAMAIPLGLCILAEILLMFMRFYTYLMVVTVDLPVKHIIKNAAIFSFLGAKTNFITLFFVLLIGVPMVLFFPITILPMVFVGFTTLAFIAVYNSYPYLIKYIIEPHERQVRGETDDDDDDDDDDEYEDDDEDEEEEDDDAPIFTDIGSREVPVQQEKKGKQKVIR